MKILEDLSPFSLSNALITDVSSTDRKVAKISIMYYVPPTPHKGTEQLLIYTEPRWHCCTSLPRKNRKGESGHTVHQVSMTHDRSPN
jgi:hypothetical protein